MRQTDLAGNVSSTTSFTFTLDTVAPTGGTPALTTGSDSGSSSSDSITKVTNPTFQVALNSTVAVGDMVELLLGGSALAHDVTHTVTAGDITVGYVSLAVTAGDLGADGTKPITAKFTDTAGNTSTTAADVITLDTTAPGVTVSTGSTTLAAGQTSTVTFAFSEEVNGFTLLDATVIEGTLSNLTHVGLSGSEDIYTATFTPDATNNEVGSVAVHASSYTDAAGNVGAASNTVHFTGDTLAGGPGNDTITAGSGFGILTGHGGADTFVFTPTALTNAEAATPIVDHVADYDQGNTGFFNASEGDKIDLSGLTGGSSFSGSLHVFDNGAKGTFLMVDSGGGANGPNYVPLAQLDGITASHTVNVIVDSTQPAGITLGVDSNQGFAGNFNGSGGTDHNSDLIWQNDNGSIALWEMNNNNHVGGGPIGNLPAGWNIAGIGDFNADGNSDLLIQSNNGALSIWEMNGNAQIGGGAVANLPASWHVAGVGDFNGDGMSDIVLRNDNGALSIWDMNGNVRTGGGLVANLPTSWHVTGVGDFNGDGKSDLLLRNDNGALSIWEMNNTVHTGGGPVANLGLDWHVEGVGDFNKDGKSDIVLRNDKGTASIWFMNGNTHTGGGPVGLLTPDWHLAGTGDFNGDGHSDLIWRNDNGAVVDWQMNGLAHTGGGLVADLGVNWSTEAHHFDLV